MNWVIPETVVLNKQRGALTETRPARGNCNHGSGDSQYCGVGTGAGIACGGGGGP